MQVTEVILLELLERMFPKGEGAVRLMAQVNNEVNKTAPPPTCHKTNGLLVDAKAAVQSFRESSWL